VGRVVIELPFAPVQEGNSGVTQNSREELINMYAELQVSGRSKIVRRQRPGLNLRLALPGKKRGIAEFTHGHYLVVAETAYKYDGTTLTQIGTLETKIGPVTIITNDNDNVLICDGADGYHYTQATGVFAKIADRDMGTVASLSGFGIYNEPGTGQFYISALNDLTSWGALDFATAESEPDKLIRVFVDHNELWLFGSKTIEVWRNVGDATFPFALNTTVQRGCGAAFSVAAEDNTLFMIGDDGIVYRMDGYRPVRISTHAIEDWLEKATSYADAEAFIYTARGHKFYTIKVPDYGTRQYNIATGLWNAAKSWGYDEWRITGGAGKSTTYQLAPAGIVTLDDTKNTDAGTVMERTAISAPAFNNGALMTFDSFMADVEVGRVATGSSEPQVSLQVSRNGETFGNIRQRGMGTTGDYARRVVWRGLGQARKFVLKLSCTDNVNFAILSTFGDLN
jgi:hypothetical protein